MTHFIVAFYLPSHAWDCGFLRPCRRDGPGFQSHIRLWLSSVGAGGSCCRYRLLSCVLCSGLGCDSTQV